jgi:alpha-mannosidase
VDLMEPGISDYLNKLADAAYPFDRIAVQFSGYSTDNSPPARKECDLVKTWAEMYAWPKLRIATVGEFPEYVEKSHAGDLSVHRQAWPDWWTDGFGSAARETAAARETQAAMQVNEGLLAIAAALGAKLPVGEMERTAAIEEALLFYDEHTFGAAESISDPLAENTKVQWGEKSSYAWEAVKSAGMLREEALGLLQGFVPRSEAATIAFFNTLGWARSGPVPAFIDHEIMPKDRKSRIVDSRSGEEIPAQLLRSRAEGSYWAFWVKNVPPLGFRTYRIMVSPEESSKPTGSITKSNVLENSFYKVEVSPLSGAVVSLMDKESNHELVDAHAPWQMGQLIYERAVDRGDFNKSSFPKDHPFQRTSLRKVQIGEVMGGPIWKSLQITAEADGFAEPGGVKLEIRLYATEKRVEFLFTVRKSPVTAPEAVYVAFPFNAPDGKIVFETQGGVVAPGENQLPGSASDWQTFQNFVAVRNRSGQIILGSDQAPLVQLGEINLGKWQPVTRVEKPYVYSWVMNNYWFTNFPASQDGEFRWSYYLTSMGEGSNAKAVDFGWSSRVPLVARVLTAGPAGRGMPSLAVLRLNLPNVALVSARPARDGNGIIVHLREVDGKAVVAKLSSSAPEVVIKSVAEVNALEETLKEATSDIAFAPYEVKFLRLITK